MTGQELHPLDLHPAGCVDPATGARVLAHLDVLATDDAGAPGDVSAHAALCGACAAEVGDARAALGELPEAAVAALVAGTPVAPTLTVVVSCVYCHDRLARPEAVYCASCLAPHHAGCFEQHGRCAVRGCEDRRFVRPVETQAPARRRGWPWGLSLVAVSIGAAALVAERRAMVAEDSPSLPEPVVTVEPADPDPVIARVDGAPIHRSALDHACALVPGYFDLPDGVERERARLDALDRLIDERAVLNAGRGYEASDEDRRRAEDALERDVSFARVDGGRHTGPRLPALALQVVPSSGITISERGLLERLLAREVADSIVRLAVPREQDVPLAEVHRYYQEHLSEFWSGGEVRFRELVLYPDPRDAARRVHGEGERFDLDEVLARAQADIQRVGFAAAASRWSMDALGGAEQLLVASELDRVLVPPLPKVLSELKEPGQLSAPVRLYTGSVHVFQLIARIDPVTRPLAEVEDEIRAQLRDERWAQRRRDWVRARRAQAQVWLGDVDPRGGAR